MTPKLSLNIATFEGEDVDAESVYIYTEHQSCDEGSRLAQDAAAILTRYCLEDGVKTSGVYICQ